jgi:ABC-2 type transport system ATP-binding protein
MNVIEINGLVRFFGATPAVTGLDLTVPRGSVVGLLGENGSGKTTTIKLIMGALVPNQGTVHVWGEDPLDMPPATRARIAYIADEMAVPGWMKLQEAMALHASYFGHWDQVMADSLMKDYELTGKQAFGGLSKGQKRRFFLVLALAQQPDLLVLDEPAGGLDTTVRRQFMDALMELAANRAVTILISSHILPDVERVVDTVAFIKRGRLLEQAALEDLKAHVKRICLSRDDDLETLQQRCSVRDTRKESGALLVTVDDFDEGKLEGIDCRVEHLNLEELFQVYNLAPASKEARET